MRTLRNLLAVVVLVASVSGCAVGFEPVGPVYGPCCGPVYGPVLGPPVFIGGGRLGGGRWGGGRGYRGGRRGR